MTGAPRCPAHQRAKNAARYRESDEQRGTAAERGYDTAWRRLRAWFLADADNALCHDCKQRGIVVAAREVHHIRKVQEYPALRLEPSNLMALCKPCHSARTKRGE